MFTKKILAASFVMISLASTFASAADQQTRIVFVGGHNPSQMFIVVPTVERDSSSYSITGQGVARPQSQYTQIKVGDRVVGLQQRSSN